MKKYFSYLLALLIGLVACDDNTGTLGGSILPNEDIITIDTATYQASTRSIAVDSVLGKTSKVYLGRFTDPQTKSVFEADFIAQLNCAEGGNVFPPSEVVKGDSIAERVELCLFFSGVFGDPTNTMTAEVYKLSQTLREGKKYYTNLNLEEFYDADAEPFATKVYVATDYTLEDSEREDENHYTNVTIPLPTEEGTRIMGLFRKHPDYFANASAFIDNVCPGFYVKAAKGDGTVLYINQVSLNIYFRDAQNDSVYVTQFASSEEVLLANRFSTKQETLKPLVEDNSCTYLKTPAGIFTEVTLPIDEIVAQDDSINAAKIFFQCYNDTYSTPYKFGIPETLLMIHKDEMYSFFEKNKLTDDISSFYAVYNSTYNRYEYSNIASLVTHCHDKRKTWQAQHPGEDIETLYPDWNKVVLIPVTVATDSSNGIVGFRHDFSLNSVRLVGGQDKIKIRVITSGFN